MTSNSLPLAILPVHFDVPDHHIPLSDFLSTAKGIEIVSQNIASKIFNEKVFVSIVVLPPEEGSLKSQIGMLLLGSVLTLTFVNDDFLEGLIGTDPRELRIEAGQSVREGIQYLANSTKNFLEKENNELDELGINNENFSVAFGGKDIFFKACLQNSEINGIGFTNEDLFSIGREGFESRIRPEEQEEPETKYLLHEVIIISPNISRESKAQWRVKDKESNKTLYFHMADISFKEQMFNHQYSFQPDDTMTVLVKYEKQLATGKYFKSAIKVYRFNDTEFEPIPDDLEIIPIVDDDPEDDQLSLF